MTKDQIKQLQSYITMAEWAIPPYPTGGIRWEAELTPSGEYKLTLYLRDKVIGCVFVTDDKIEVLARGKEVGPKEHGRPPFWDEGRDCVHDDGGYYHDLVQERLRESFQRLLEVLLSAAV